MLKVSATTCRTYNSGDGYFCMRRKRVIRVPNTHKAIACQECEFSLHLPIDLSDQLENKRIQHLKYAHSRQIHTGEMTIHLEGASERLDEVSDIIGASFKL